MPADAATLEGVKHLVAEVKKHTDHVDILLANAGATWGEKFDTHPDSAFAKVMDLNVRGVFNTIREMAPLLEKRGSVADPSRVIITASVAGLGIGTIGKQGTYGMCYLASTFFFLAGWVTDVGKQATAPPRRPSSTWVATWRSSWDPGTSRSTASARASSRAR